MSWPAKWIRPASGATSPVNWPISVVLPAPFGPMMACSSPAGTARSMPSEAVTPPKRLVRPSMANSASVTAQALQETVDAAAREQHDQEEQRAKHDLPVLGGARGGGADERCRDEFDQHRQRFFQHQQRDGAEE